MQIDQPPRLRPACGTLPQAVRPLFYGTRRQPAIHGMTP